MTASWRMSNDMMGLAAQLATPDPPPPGVKPGDMDRLEREKARLEESKRRLVKSLRMSEEAKRALEHENKGLMTQLAEAGSSEQHLGGRGPHRPMNSGERPTECNGASASRAPAPGIGGRDLHRQLGTRDSDMTSMNSRVVRSFEAANTLSSSRATARSAMSIAQAYDAGKAGSKGKQSAQRASPSSSGRALSPTSSGAPSPAQASSPTGQRSQQGNRGSSPSRTSSPGRGSSPMARRGNASNKDGSAPASQRGSRNPSPRHQRISADPRCIEASRQSGYAEGDPASAFAEGSDQEHEVLCSEMVTPHRSWSQRLPPRAASPTSSPAAGSSCVTHPASSAASSRASSAHRRPHLESSRAGPSRPGASPGQARKGAAPSTTKSAGRRAPYSPPGSVSGSRHSAPTSRFSTARSTPTTRTPMDRTPLDRTPINRSPCSTPPCCSTPKNTVVPESKAALLQKNFVQAVEQQWETMRGQWSDEEEAEIRTPRMREGDGDSVTSVGESSCPSSPVSACLPSPCLPTKSEAEALDPAAFGYRQRLFFSGHTYEASTATPDGMSSNGMSSCIHPDGMCSNGMSSNGSYIPQRQTLSEALPELRNEQHHSNHEGDAMDMPLIIRHTTRPAATAETMLPPPSVPLLETFEAKALREEVARELSEPHSPKRTSSLRSSPQTAGGDTERKLVVPTSARQGFRAASNLHSRSTSSLLSTPPSLRVSTAPGSSPTRSAAMASGKQSALQHTVSMAASATTSRPLLQHTRPMFPMSPPSPAASTPASARWQQSSGQLQRQFEATDVSSGAARLSSNAHRPSNGSALQRKVHPA